MMEPTHFRLPKDARLYQIAVLASLLTYGAFFLDFTLPSIAPVTTLLTALTLEHLTFRFRGSPGSRPPYESAVIASLSTMLLLRTNEVWVYAASVSFAILSKVLLRVGGRHFVNPTNGGVLLASVLLPGWISSGQWGHDLVFVFALLSGGILVLTRAGRGDSAIAFLVALLAAQGTRVLVFGYQPATILHLFQNGAVWLFALYMITDPRTTPETRGFRIVHATIVAFLAMSMVQFFFARDAILWSLLLCSPTIPLLNALAKRTPKGASLETNLVPRT